MEPRELPAAGGSVTIGISATDNRGISEMLTIDRADGAQPDLAVGLSG